MNCNVHESSHLKDSQLHNGIGSYSNDFEYYIDGNYVFSDQSVNLDHDADWPITEMDSINVCPCSCGVGFVTHHFTNTDLTRASYLCRSCNFNLNDFTKITCMETGTKKADLHPHISNCSIQMLNWTDLGHQGLAPIIFLNDHFNSINNGFYFLYKTNHAEASILKCHTCPEVPLNVIKVHVNIMVHFGHPIKSDNVTPSNKLQPNEAYQNFYKDVYCWENYNMGYTEYMQDIIDRLILIDDMAKPKNHSDTALADLVYDTNNTNTITNLDPHCMTEDDLDFCKDNLSDSDLPDVNFPDKEWGYIVTEDNSFTFIGPDRPYPSIKCAEDYIQLAHMIRVSQSSHSFRPQAKTIFQLFLTKRQYRNILTRKFRLVPF